MKKVTKHLIGIATLTLILSSQFGLFIIWLKLMDPIQLIFQANSLPIRIILGLMLFILMIASTIFSPLFIFGSIYINLLSMLELKHYLLGIDEREASKFLARLIWLSNINVRKYRGNEYLIYRMFYPQAGLFPKNSIIWVIKIKYKNIEFLVDNGFGKPSYYKEDFLYRFIIKPMYPDDYQKILLMANFLHDNFQSDLTDAQINISLEQLYSSNNDSHPSNQS